MSTTINTAEFGARPTCDVGTLPAANSTSDVVDSSVNSSQIVGLEGGAVQQSATGAVAGDAVQQSGVAGNPLCFQNFANVQLLYWPVTALSGDLCQSSRSTATMTPTISVYMQFDGTWVYENMGRTTSSQSRLLLT
ncbi:hypothetical protein B0A50_06845 [Salinomyces thailandicus]|uniref:Uncharacterized protein n=1 Tax=Salinomyces thailandicus TaxID=706561 RepID=A0A4U0TQS3_9PEZI|nr:hypothetical protein B0A50_06845 [Salinomyces thailandica]